MQAIDKNVPMPPFGRGKRKYPWDELEVGESFLVPVPGNARSLSVSAMRTRPGKAFVARMTDGVSRVWRTA